MNETRLKNIETSWRLMSCVAEASPLWLEKTREEVRELVAEVRRLREVHLAALEAQPFAQILKTWDEEEIPGPSFLAVEDPE